MLKEKVIVEARAIYTPELNDNKSGDYKTIPLVKSNTQKSQRNKSILVIAITIAVVIFAIVLSISKNRSSDSSGKLNTLNGFCQEYIESSESINKFINPAIGLMFLNNPGSRCTGSMVNSIKFSDIKVTTSNTFPFMANGNSCDGYLNAKDGFYYKSITVDELPVFIDNNEDIRSLQIPNAIGNYKLFRMTLVQNESWVMDFYVISISGNFFLICQDNCDCSS